MQIIIIAVLAFVIYFGQMSLFRRFWDKNLDVRISFQDRMIEAGEKTKLFVTIENRKLFILPVLNLKISAPKSFIFKGETNSIVTDKYYRNEAFSVMANQRVTRKLEFKGNNRGYFTLPTTNVVVKDLFLTNTYARNYSSDAALYVLPRKIEKREFGELRKSIQGEIETKRSFIEDPFSFVGIRDYTVNDSMRRVNWKATARTNDLKVNMYSKVAEQRVAILVNLETHIPFKVEAIREAAFEIASTLGKDFVESSIPVMVEANGLDIMTEAHDKVDFGTSLNHSIAIDKYLARIGTYQDNETFINMLDKYRDTVSDNVSYIIISPSMKEDVLIKLDELCQYGLHINMIVPYDSKTSFEAKREYISGWEVDVDEFYEANI